MCVYSSAEAQATRPEDFQPINAPKDIFYVLRAAYVDAELGSGCIFSSLSFGAGGSGFKSRRARRSPRSLLGEDPEC